MHEEYQALILKHQWPTKRNGTLVNVVEVRHISEITQPIADSYRQRLDEKNEEIKKLTEELYQLRNELRALQKTNKSVIERISEELTRIN